jgi:hypothetical protein
MRSRGKGVLSTVLAVEIQVLSAFFLLLVFEVETNVNSSIAFCYVINDKVYG